MASHSETGSFQSTGHVSAPADVVSRTILALPQRARRLLLSPWARQRLEGDAATAGPAGHLRRVTRAPLAVGNVHLLLQRLQRNSREGHGPETGRGAALASFCAAVRQHRCAARFAPRRWNGRLGLVEWWAEELDLALPSGPGGRSTRERSRSRAALRCEGRACLAWGNALSRCAHQLQRARGLHAQRLLGRAQRRAHPGSN